MKSRSIGNQFAAVKFDSNNIRSLYPIFFAAIVKSTKKCKKDSIYALPKEIKSNYKKK